MVAVTVALTRTTGAAAQAEEATPLRLPDVVAEALARNPEVQAARARAAAAAEVPARVSAYDDPVFTYEAWNIPESVAIDRADNNILKLSQRIPFPGKRSRTGAMAHREAEIAATEADTSALDIVASAKQAFYALWLAHQNASVYGRDKLLVERVARVTTDRYAAGEVAQPDVLRAQVELAHFERRLRTADLAIASARAELNTVLSHPPDAAVGVPEEPRAFALSSDAAQLIDRALRERPELAARRAAIQREEESVRLARLDYLPDFELSVSRFFNAGQADGFGAMASISLPFAYKAKYDAGVAEANARLTAARAEQRRAEDRVRGEVQQAYLRAHTALTQHDLFVRVHTPQAEQVMEATESAYQTNQIEFSSLIDSLRAIEAVHLEHYQAAADFERAYADLERAVGGDIERLSSASSGESDVRAEEP